MTTYKEIFGKYVKNYSSDPTADIEGQIWYNTTSGTFKTNVNAGAAWASGGNMTAAQSQLAGAGTQTAGLAFGGLDLPSTQVATTQEYDGTSWGPGGNMATARFQLAGCGTQTAGLGFGGYIIPGTTSAATEEYDGTTWGPGGNLGTARRLFAGAGTQTAGLAIGGYTTTAVANTEEYTGAIFTPTASTLTTS